MRWRRLSSLIFLGLSVVEQAQADMVIAEDGRQFSQSQRALTPVQKAVIPTSDFFTPPLGLATQADALDLMRRRQHLSPR